MNAASSSDDGGELATPVKTASDSKDSTHPRSPLGSAFRGSGVRGSADVRRRRQSTRSRSGSYVHELVVIDDLIIQERPPRSTPIQLAADVRSATQNYFMIPTIPTPGGSSLPHPTKMAAYNGIKYASSNETTGLTWNERWNWSKAPASSRAHARWSSDVWRDTTDGNSRWGRRLASEAGGPPPSWVPCCRSMSFSDDVDELGAASPAMLPPDPVHGESSPKYTTGNNRSYLGGRIIVGPDVRQLIGSALGICLPAPLVTAGMASDLPVGLTTLLWILWALSLGSLMWTALSDPGIVTRRKEDVEVPENVIVSVELPDIKGKRGSITKTASLKTSWKSIPLSAEFTAARREAQRRYLSARKEARLENRVHPYTMLWPFSLVTGKAKAVDAQTLFVRRMLFAQHRLQIEALVAATHQINIAASGDMPRNCDIISLATLLLSSSDRFKNNRYCLSALLSRHVPLCSCGSLLVARAQVRQWSRGHFCVPTPENNADIHGTTAVSTAQRGHHKYCLAYHYNTSIKRDSVLSLISLTLDSVTGFSTTGQTPPAATYLDAVTLGLPEGLARRLRGLISHTVRRMLAESGQIVEDSDKGCRQLVQRPCRKCIEGPNEDDDHMEDVKTNLARLGATTIVPLVAKEVPLRYCYYCCVYRGPRTHHCRRCQNCVDLFDHHCPWTGTCIGGKNYHCFLVFLLSLNSYLLLGMVCCVVGPVVRSIDESIDIAEALLDQYVFPVILFLLLGLAGNTILSLLFYHMYIVAKGVTTLEHIRQAWRVITPSGLAKNAPPQPVVVDECDTTCSDTSESDQSDSSHGDCHEDTVEDRQEFNRMHIAANASGISEEVIAKRIEDIRRSRVAARIRSKQQRASSKRDKKSTKKKAPVKIRNVWSQGGVFSNCWSRWSGQIEPKVLSREFRRVLKDEILLLDGGDNVYADSDVDDPDPQYFGVLESGVQSLKQLVLVVPPERISPSAAVFPGNRYAAQPTTPNDFSDVEDAGGDDGDKRSTAYLLQSLKAHDDASNGIVNISVSTRPVPIGTQQSTETDPYPTAAYTDRSQGTHGSPVDGDMIPTKRKGKPKEKELRQLNEPEPSAAVSVAQECQPTPTWANPADAERPADDITFRSAEEFSQETASSRGSPAPSTDDEGSLQLSIYSSRSHSMIRSSIVGRDGSTSQHPDMVIGANMSASTGEMMGAIADGSFPSSRRHTAGGSPQFLQRHSSLAGRGNQSGVTTPHLTNPVVAPSPRDRGDQGVGPMGNIHSLSMSSSPRPAANLSTAFVYPDDALTSQPRRGREGSEVFGDPVEEHALGMSGSYDASATPEETTRRGATPQVRVQTPPQSPVSSDSGVFRQHEMTVVGANQLKLI